MTFIKHSLFLSQRPNHLYIHQLS